MFQFVAVKIHTHRSYNMKIFYTYTFREKRSECKFLGTFIYITIYYSGEEYSEMFYV